MIERCVRFQFNLKESHIIALKKLFKLLVGTIDYGLWYLRTDFDFVGYSNADFVRNKVNNRKKALVNSLNFLAHAWYIEIVKSKVS